MATSGPQVHILSPRQSRLTCGILSLAMTLGTIALAQAKVEAASIAILLAPHDAYKSAAIAAEKTLGDKGHEVKLYELPRQGPSVTTGTASQPGAPPAASSDLFDVLKRVEGVRPSVIITIGEQATSAALENIKAVPVVYGMITNASDFPMTERSNTHYSRVAGVTTDVLPRTQLQWIGKVQPQVRSVGVLYSLRSKRTAEAIHRAGTETSLSIALIETSRDEFAKGIEELTRRNCDALLMIADAQVYTKDTVRPALLWGLRQKKAVWAFSENFVKSGALGGCYTSYESIGQQTARVAMRVLAGEAPSKIGLQYPDQIQKAVNERTASMIGLTIPGPVLNETTIRYGNE
ncbi:MAG: hypothetical protein KA354_07330 [Phycisphaerae bacterium]|nr:hypothetical protein [Phycisphaerae bacterium]